MFDATNWFLDPSLKLVSHQTCVMCDEDHCYATHLTESVTWDSYSFVVNHKSDIELSNTSNKINNIYLLFMILHDDDVYLICTYTHLRQKYTHSTLDTDTGSINILKLCHHQCLKYILWMNCCVMHCDVSLFFIKNDWRRL